MERINAMVSNESKSFLLQYQTCGGYRKIDDALDALIKEHHESSKPNVTA
jgi:hypothetical protein